MFFIVKRDYLVQHPLKKNNYTYITYQTLSLILTLVKSDLIYPLSFEYMVTYQFPNFYYNIELTTPYTDIEYILSNNVKF